MGSCIQQLLAGVSVDVPVTIPGLVGWYDYGSYAAGTWTDKSGSGNNASSAVSSPSTGTTSAHGSSMTLNRLLFAFTGGVAYNDMVFPTAILPATYTLFHVARQTNVSNNRIFAGYDQNWLSGWWAANMHQGFHQGWLTTAGGTATDSNWHYTTDQNSLLRQDGVTYGTSGAGAPSYARLSINNGLGTQSEASDCEVTEVIVYNRTLNSTEYGTVESYLKARYGL